MEEIFNKNKFRYDVDKLYPLIFNNKLYLYIIESLFEYIKSNCNEVYSKKISNLDKIKINKLYKQLYKKKDK